MSQSNSLVWCFTAREEYPPEDCLTWTTDGQKVLKGRYAHPDILAGASLEEGAWTDEQGEPIAVKAWLPVEESPDSPPDLPDPFPEYSDYVCHLPCCNPWAGTIWTPYKGGDTTPPVSTWAEEPEPCWTIDASTEGAKPRKGFWYMFDPIQYDADGWQEGEWRGLDGEVISVTHWHDIVEGDEEPPEFPSPR